HDTGHPLDNLDPALSANADEVKNEFDNFSDCDYEDNIALIEYKDRLLDDLSGLLENPAAEIVSEEREKRKKKSKKKEAKVKKKRKKNNR
ncbi:hypothetical protein evm_015279, partial [Chilo suppressalis]